MKQAYWDNVFLDEMIDNFIKQMEEEVENHVTND